VVAARDQLSSEVGGETVILNLPAGLYFGLDEVGTRVWALVQRPLSVDRICEALMQEFDVETERCERAVLDFLAEMERAGLVEEAR
jgi:hypothetical protein